MFLSTERGMKSACIVFVKVVENNAINFTKDLQNIEKDDPSKLKKY